MSVRKRIWKTAAGAIKAKISDSRDLIETYKKESGLEARQRESAREGGESHVDDSSVCRFPGVEPRNAPRAAAAEKSSTAQRHIQEIRRWTRGYAEKMVYQWFFLFICVPRSA